jgi:hypothetical protein
MADDTLPLPLPPRPSGKRCKRCRKEKPLSEFHYRPEQRRYRAECKECYRAAMTANRDPLDNRARVKKWRKEHPEKVGEYSRRNHEGRRTDLVRWIASNLRSTRAYCKRRGIECRLTGDQVRGLYERQDGKCALTGRDLIFGSKGQQRDSLSIDRIEHGADYSLDNVRLVIFQANVARHCWSDDELFAFCKAVLATRQIVLG